MSESFPCSSSSSPSTTAMCYACQPRVTAFAMPSVQTRRPEPTGPQYFTFDPLPEFETTAAPPRKGSKTHRIKKRTRRVLYPPVGKRYFPTEEPNYAKRLLFILLAVVFFQIYSAEEELPATLLPLSAEDNTSHCSVELRQASGEPLFLLQEPGLEASSVENAKVVNVTTWHWGEGEMSESAVDITQYLEQSPAAF